MSDIVTWKIIITDENGKENSWETEGDILQQDDDIAYLTKEGKVVLMVVKSSKMGMRVVKVGSDNWNYGNPAWVIKATKVHISCGEISLLLYYNDHE